MDTITFITKCIKRKQPIEGRYQGLLRKLCPHVLGWKNGTIHVLCWQYGGESSKGGLPEWRCIPVEEMAGLHPLYEPWHTSPNYSLPLQHCMDEVIEAV